MPLLSVIPWLMMAIQYLQQVHALPFFLKPTPVLVGSYAIVKHRLKNISLTWQHKQTITETLSLCIRLRKHEAISYVHLFCSMYLQRYTYQLYQYLTLHLIFYTIKVKTWIQTPLDCAIVLCLLIMTPMQYLQRSWSRLGVTLQDWWGACLESVYMVSMAGFCCNIKLRSIFVSSICMWLWGIIKKCPVTSCPPAITGCK